MLPYPLEESVIEIQIDVKGKMRRKAGVNREWGKQLSGQVVRWLSDQQLNNSTTQLLLAVEYLEQFEPEDADGAG
jgi:hypothetical protein